MKKEFLVIMIFMINLCSNAQSVTDGLVAHFPFDGNAIDQTTNNNHGSIAVATATTDRFGTANSAYNFNGTNNYIQVGTNGIDVTQGTIAVWVKPNVPGSSQNPWMLFDTFPTASYTAQRIILWKGGTGGGAGTNLICGISSFNDLALNISHWQENMWHHVVMRWRAKNDGSDFISLYVDGIKVAEKNNLSKNMNTILATANIGQHYKDNHSFFNGDMDDYKIYNRSLSDSEVAMLYAENSSNTDTETDPNTAADPSNVFVGKDAGTNNTIGINNVFVGANSGRSNTTGQTNVFIGRNSGRNNVEGNNNVFNGNAAGLNNASGNFNTLLGASAGRENIEGRRNVFIGGNAGRNSVGNANILIGYRAGFNETGNNKLIIENSDSDTPLIYGDFATDQLGINTNTIPDGYNFAVGGGAIIDGSIKAGTLDIEAPDNSEDWLPVTIGREVKPFFRNFNFVVSPSTNTNELLGFTIIDKNLISRQDNYFRDDFTRISYMSNRNQYIFSLDHNDREGQDQAAIQMPLVNSKIVIAGFGDYLEDQGHKLIVKDGTALIENAIYTNGRIAIGTTEEDPGYALTVKGKVHVQEVKVDLLGVLAPDYVFYEDYKLKTLEQVEDYIDQEGHLPNIPSALEMEKEGVNLKEMNMKLLEKVEELTLYTIAQEKAIKEQQETNDALEKRLKKLEELLNK